MVPLECQQEPDGDAARPSPLINEAAALSEEVPHAIDLALGRPADGVALQRSGSEAMADDEDEVPW